MIMRHIQKAIKESDSSYKLYPQQNNINLLHFSLKGPKDTVYQDGIYHGIITMTDKFPFDPPKIRFVSPSGRFEQQVDICLSYSTGMWSPATSIGGLLISIQSIFTDKDFNGIGIIKNCCDLQLKIHAEESKKFVCYGCGCDHSKF